jgi:hypothetical protein
MQNGLQPVRFLPPGLKRGASPTATLAAVALAALLPAALAGAGDGKPPQADWLINPAPFVAKVTPAADGRDVTLENGLVRRVIRLAPNAATIGFENLMTGESILRSVRPEAEVTIDGAVYPVGGLEGQPAHNYLDPGWLARMTTLPGAYVFDHFETGVTAPRFPWQKRLEWMPKDAPWPPPGKSLTLFFRPPVAPPSAATGPLLLEDNFQGPLKQAWTVRLSASHARASFANEGKAGEIMALPDTCVFAERPLPGNAASVEVVADTGDDTEANSWGPGLALMAGGKAVASLVLRPNSQQYEFFTPATGQQVVERFDRAKAATLRIRLAGDRVHFEASQDGRKFLALGQARLEKKPDSLRVGKVGRYGEGVDYSPAPADPAKLPTRCHILNVAVRGVETSAKPAARDDLPAIQVHYEIYDGIPLLSKWITVSNGTPKAVQLNKFTCEILAVVESESIVDDTPVWRTPDNLIAETDYTFGGMSGPNHSAGVHWESDPLYSSQVNFNRRTPCLLLCKPPLGPDQMVPPGGVFESFRAFELLPDSTDRERRTLASRRMYRTVAPWVTENPVLMHVRSAKPEAVKQAIDQCAEVGFEMVILTFGSGFNFESRDPAYQAKIKELADYGRAKGIALGGYSLCASRGAATGADNTQGVPARFGVAPCLAATWGSNYLAQLRQFMDGAGLGVLEHDGSYPGDRCAATNHPGHRGLEDSQWAQWRAITGLYEWCCGHGVYLNIPDWYFLNGGTKTAMGYREVNWSLPREYQEIIERQNIFDGTWDKTPSMGWMFVPLTEYQGGGAAATIEPLKDHLPHYEQRLANLFGAGVQACYRGPRLFDTPETEAVVKKWVDFYKKHRAILDSDILHLRRADGRDLDYILHVNPALPEKGLLMVYNPLDHEVKKTLKIPLYYAGLAGRTTVRERDGAGETFTLARDYSIDLPVTIPARGVSWFVFE